MNYRKGRLNQKGIWNIGKWIKRHRDKRTCRETIQFLDEDDLRVQPTICDCAIGEFRGKCPSCGKENGNN